MHYLNANNLSRSSHEDAAGVAAGTNTPSGDPQIDAEYLSLNTRCALKLLSQQ